MSLSLSLICVVNQIFHSIVFRSILGDYVRAGQTGNDHWDQTESRRASCFVHEIFQLGEGQVNNFIKNNKMQETET